MTIIPAYKFVLPNGRTIGKEMTEHEAKAKLPDMQSQFSGISIEVVGELNKGKKTNLLVFMGGEGA